MKHLWTGIVEFYGYRVGNSLFTASGVEAGRIFGEGEIFGSDGTYLGQLEMKRG